MKHRLIILLLLCSVQPVLAQKIDDLKTEKQIEAYIAKKRGFKKYSLDGKSDCEENTFRIKRNLPDGKRWAKKDLNGDGYVDLFAVGCAYRVSKKNRDERAFSEVSIILGGKKQTVVVEMPIIFFHSVYFVGKSAIPELRDIADRTYLIMGHTQFDLKTGVALDESYEDTLQFVGNNLLPYSEEADEKVFSSFKLESSYCYGTCPVFELMLKSDGSGSFYGKDFTKKKGRIQVQADKEDIEYINTTLNHMRVSSLEESYSIDWTDHASNTLTISFTDGSEKVIKDYGQIGTLHLTILYDYLYKLLEDYI